MEIINENALHVFAKKHPHARRPLANWVVLIKSAEWNSFADVRTTLRSADYVKERVVFDIGGNNFRIISSIDYSGGRVFILEVMTHSEYDRWHA